jgi:hypothetical protein
MKKQIILYILARVVQVIVTALASNITVLLFMDVAYQERGYLAVGGEMFPVAIVAVAVWYGLGWLMREWCRTMRGGRK